MYMRVDEGCNCYPSEWINLKGGKKRIEGITSFLSGNYALDRLIIIKGRGVSIFI